MLLFALHDITCIRTFRLIIDSVIKRLFQLFSKLDEEDDIHYDGLLQREMMVIPLDKSRGPLRDKKQLVEITTRNIACTMAKCLVIKATFTLKMRSLFECYFYVQQNVSVIEMFSNVSARNGGFSSQC